MTGPVAIDDVAQALTDGGSAVHPAEAHGCLCGALCARRQYLLSEWIDELLPEPDAEIASGLAGGPLGILFESSQAALAEGNLEFSPLLPDDEVDLLPRVDALAAWCEGFLYGFGSAGTIPQSALGGEVREFLADAVELSRAGTDGESPVEVEEEAYAELVEYLRVGVQLVYDELEVHRAGQPAADPKH